MHRDLDDRGRPAANQTASNVINGDTHDCATDARPFVALSPFEYGVLYDAFTTGRKAWWLKRAQDFENAKPRLDDFHGDATPAELSERWQFCERVARACRAKAALIEIEELEHLLREVA